VEMAPRTAARTVNVPTSVRVPKNRPAATITVVTTVRGASAEVAAVVQVVAEAVVVAAGIAVPPMDATKLRSL
jgi:hypothetical protein